MADRPDPLLVVRRAVVVATTACLLASCGGGDQRAGEAGSSATSGSTSSPGAPSPPGSPGPASGETGEATLVPRDPAALARQLDAAVATVRDRHATDEAVREAGEFQQLAVRALATGSDAFRRKVLARLRPVPARQTRGDVRATQLLTVLTAPRRRFPPWRIVTPPPAPVLLGYYREAQRRTGVPWTYLAAIHLVETRMGRIRGPSTAGALGPMQFMPATWARFGAGGDINDPEDAIQAAGRLLAAHGAPRDMATALWHYNPSAKYVGAVTEYARTMQRSDAAYRGYWQWRVLYRHARGIYVLPEGYPRTRPVPLPASLR